MAKIPAIEGPRAPKTIRRTTLGYICKLPDDTLAEAIGYHASPDGTVDLNKSAEEAKGFLDPGIYTPEELAGARVFRIVAEAM